MKKNSRENRLEAEINTAKELPIFSDTQLEAFFSNKVDSLDEALAVLDESNNFTVSQSDSFLENKKGGI